MVQVWISKLPGSLPCENKTACLRRTENYKTVLCKEEALQKVIAKDPEEGLASGPFSESELRGGGKHPKVLLILRGRGWGSKIPQNQMSEHLPMQRREAPTDTFVLQRSLQVLVLKMQWGLWTA